MHCDTQHRPDWVEGIGDIYGAEVIWRPPAESPPVFKPSALGPGKPPTETQTAIRSNALRKPVGKKQIILGVVVAAVVIGFLAAHSSNSNGSATGSASGGGSPSGNSRMQVALVLGDGTGDLAIDIPNYKQGTPCSETSGGVNVTLTNQNGTVLGQQSLPDQAGNGTATPVNSGWGCQFTLDFGNVPGESQYGVSVNGSNSIFFSGSQAQADNNVLSVVYPS